MPFIIFLIVHCEYMACGVLVFHESHELNCNGNKTRARKLKYFFFAFLGTKKREESYSPAYSDSDSQYSDDQEDAEDYKKGGYHPVKIGENFKNGRYTVLQKLGWGHFSTVWLVRDNARDERLAMKVVKSASHYTEAARDEILLLSKAKELDPDDRCHCCRIIDFFDHSGPHGKHVCMVFEVLGDNLLALIRHYNHRGIPLPIVRQLTKQILIALDFLHSSCGIIHTDLKPENVMLKEPIKPRPPPKMVNLSLCNRDHQPKGKIAAALAAGQTLTKNQKKKLRKKMQKSEDISASAQNNEKSNSVTSNSNSGDKNDDCEALSTGNESHRQISEMNTQANLASNGNAALSSDDDGISGFDRRHESPEALKARLMTMPCKIVDFGNACWVDKHFTDDIQTRQYRSPEVI